MQKSLKVLSVFGTRPEAIKMAPVVVGLRAQKSIDLRICVTGQHREMLDQVLEFFSIKPDYDLDIMRGAQGLNDITANVLLKLTKVLEDFKPDLVVVHGDTTTTLSTSLASFNNRVAVAHVEAGLRTGDLSSPWPEEMNRKVTGVIARLHFAPTLISKENLLSEGVNENHITVTGNTVIDALKIATRKIENNSKIREDFEQKFKIPKSKKMILVTGHRRESFGGGFERICEALENLSKRDDVEIIYPVHLNPNVKVIVEKSLGRCKNVQLLPPQDYLSFVYLMSKSHIILTDSGGVQEEAPSIGKPVLVMRDTTERPEAVKAGTVKLVGTDSKAIQKEAELLLDDTDVYNQMSRAINPYGDGLAAERIVMEIVNWATERDTKGLASFV